MQKKYDTTVLGLVVLDILGRPVSKIPDGGNLAYIDELRLTAVSYTHLTLPTIYSV